MISTVSDFCHSSSEVELIYARPGCLKQRSSSTAYHCGDGRGGGATDMSSEDTSSSAVAKRLRDALYHRIFCQVTQGHSRSFEMTLLSRAYVSPF